MKKSLNKFIKGYMEVLYALSWNDTPAEKED